TRSGARAIIAQPESSASAAMAWRRAILARGAGLGESPASDSSLTGFAEIVFRRRRFLETVRELRAKNVDRALVGSDELPVGRCVSAVLVNGRVLDKEMRVPEVERTVLGQLVLAANRQPQAIVVGQPCGAVGVVHGCLVIREAHLRRPGIVIAMDRTNPDTPGVPEVLGGTAQWS